MTAGRAVAVVGVVIELAFGSGRVDGGDVVGVAGALCPFTIVAVGIAAAVGSSSGRGGGGDDSGGRASGGGGAGSINQPASNQQPVASSR